VPDRSVPPPIPDYSDLWWGLPPQAVSDAVAALASTPKPSHVTPIESDVIVSLSAALPALHKAWVESAVMDVALALHRNRMVFLDQDRTWDDSHENAQQGYIDEARGVLLFAPRDPRRYRCPTCPAGFGESCVTRAGRRAKAPHARRVALGLDGEETR
jgi:hypothetical protein